jgi:excisionase family DNA binding protein
MFPGMETQTKTWLTRHQAADRADVHLRTVARWLADGTLTRHLVHGRSRVRIDADELDRATVPGADAAVNQERVAS